MNSNSRISLVLPYHLQESGDGVEQWRYGKLEYDPVDLVVLLSSLKKYLVTSDIEELLVIATQPSVDYVRRIVAQVEPGFTVRIVAEDEFFSACLPYVPGGDYELKSWHLQQIIKLAAAAWVRTPFYLTLDSDVVLVKPCRLSDLVFDGKSFIGRERLSDYLCLYHRDFAERECEIKRNRYKASARILRIPETFAHRVPIYNETPAMLSRDVSLAVIRSLEEIYGDDWTLTLLSCPGWTEYTLYFLWAFNKGWLHRFHEERPFSYVVDLRVSAYHETHRYRSDRPYHCWFGRDRLSQKGGFFVVFQSWIEPVQWIPAGFRNQREFYQALCDDLDLESALEILV